MDGLFKLVVNFKQLIAYKWFSFLVKIHSSNIEFGVLIKYGWI